MKNLVSILDKVDTHTMDKQVIVVKLPKPYTRKSIKPRQAHKLATRYTRKTKHQNREFV
jgi:hypothetical protein